ncbi:hypothetical protein ASPWEDRAFT_42529 [Aspergillus wentii DTO 134E9]|uniref:Uncharacterized protein n=1 Tax=Aspergillus wentii DTO 134E9 TaxID=1073089 RepID=A0A1L9RI39_ASPWE|nr:uncharacterized protein ASPWEDRAFT_42529 [Aspergillus wentii DTO 134E9]OJJ34528.1 hypothetical protein ASPWEDRAFT_42529 [Aspergillus wentii DTO 134E9]
MKVSAILFFILPLQALAGTCYFCENTPHVGSVSPTFDCGKKCGLDNYNTDISTYHCWEDSDGAGSCFKKCCAAGGTEATTISGL